METENSFAWKKNKKLQKELQKVQTSNFWILNIHKMRWPASHTLYVFWKDFKIRILCLFVFWAKISCRNNGVNMEKTFSPNRNHSSMFPELEKTVEHWTITDQKLKMVRLLFVCTIKYQFWSRLFRVKACFFDITPLTNISSCLRLPDQHLCLLLRWPPIFTIQWTPVRQKVSVPYSICR